MYRTRRDQRRICALGAGIMFVNQNYNEIREKLDDLTTYLNYSLSSLPVKIYTSPQNSFGVFAFNIDDVNSTELASYYDQKWNICLRGGYHCAAKKHEALGTLDQGAVRASMSYFNTIADIQHLITATKAFLKKQ